MRGTRADTHTYTRQSGAEGSGELPGTLFSLDPAMDGDKATRSAAVTALRRDHPAP